MPVRCYKAISIYAALDIKSEKEMSWRTFVMSSGPKIITVQYCSVYKPGWSTELRRFETDDILQTVAASSWTVLRAASATVPAIVSASLPVKHIQRGRQAFLRQKGTRLLPQGCQLHPAVITLDQLIHAIPALIPFETNEIQLNTIQKSLALASMARDDLPTSSKVAAMRGKVGSAFET